MISTIVIDSRHRSLILQAADELDALQEDIDQRNSDAEDRRYD
jgi:hypothetical protein